MMGTVPTSPAPRMPWESDTTYKQRLWEHAWQTRRHLPPHERVARTMRLLEIAAKEGIQL